MIPRILHRIWLDDRLPEEFDEYGRRWAALHPEWEMRDWRSSAELPPLRNQHLFDRAQECYPRDWKRCQADLLRLELLESYGGMYVDADTAPRRPLGPMVEARSCVVAHSPQHIQGDHPITNCVMAAAPHHPYISALIEGADRALQTYGRRPLAQSIGPWHLTRTYRNGNWPDVALLGAEEMFGQHQGWVRHDWNNAARKRGEGVW